MEIEFKTKVPKQIKVRTIENIERYGMSLGDAFNEAVLTYAKVGTKLYKAWYNSDFREYIPQIYIEEYLDFEKYPLRY